MEVKVLKEYDMKRVISRAKKEFGIIIRGHEEEYNPQLNNLEHVIYKTYKKITISDRELQQCIEMIIYDLKSIIDNIDYNYKDIRDKKLIDFSKELEKYFNPLINKDIKIDEDSYKDIKEIFILPIKCLLRIYDSIDFWNKRYGNNGYYKMLKEYVIPLYAMSNYPYIIDYYYILEKSNHNDEIDETLSDLYDRMDYNCPIPTKEDMDDLIKVINFSLKFSRDNNIKSSKKFDEYDVLDDFFENILGLFNCSIHNLDENIYDLNKIIVVLEDIMYTLKLNSITYENIFRSKVYLMFKLNKYNEAEEIMKKYIEKHPKNVFGYVELVDDFVMINNLDKAKYYYELGIINKDMIDLDVLEDRYEKVYK